MAPHFLFTSASKQVSTQGSVLFLPHSRPTLKFPNHRSVSQAPTTVLLSQVLYFGFQAQDSVLHSPHPRVFSGLHMLGSSSLSSHSNLSILSPPFPDIPTFSPDLHYITLHATLLRRHLPVLFRFLTPKVIILYFSFTLWHLSYTAVHLRLSMQCPRLHFILPRPPLHSLSGYTTL